MVILLGLMRIKNMKKNFIISFEMNQGLYREDMSGRVRNERTLIR